ncbi:MAG: hypothetical protein ABI844_14055 [Saprospiraceae bacterium]
MKYLISVALLSLAIRVSAQEILIDDGFAGAKANKDYKTFYVRVDEEGAIQKLVTNFFTKEKISTENITCTILLALEINVYGDPTLTKVTCADAKINLSPFKLEKLVGNMTKWIPANTKGKEIMAKVLLSIKIDNGKLSTRFFKM